MLSSTDAMIKAIVRTYISVMGAEKWESLTDQQKRDVVMTIVTDFYKACEKMEG